ncbi:hypothetical protein RISK_006565 [Rhodopirellula islandica]|uniref:Uncharacterized protein n=1 Tax=Rhodopirellula islandica TaxID=595434 RepID=A0A0J1E7H2_RHOIS|nr:hypothetical protein RISK_006565 [Rhodopirellula islandica]
MHWDALQVLKLRLVDWFDWPSSMNIIDNGIAHGWRVRYEWGCQRRLAINEMNTASKA